MGTCLNFAKNAYSSMMKKALISMVMLARVTFQKHSIKKIHHYVLEQRKHNHMHIHKKRTHDFRYRYINLRTAKEIESEVSNQTYSTQHTLTFLLFIPFCS